MHVTAAAKFTAIAACDPQGVIGSGGTLPWHYPEDLKHFRSTTLGHTMVMGYKTFLSMPPQAFEGRTCFVFTKHHIVDKRLATQVSGLKELAQIYAKHPKLLEKTPFVIGGEEIFNLFFAHELVECALITHLQKSYEGDTFFPLNFIANWAKEILQSKPAFSIIKYLKGLN